MSVTFPGESREYRVARERLLAREIELRRLTEAVAVERRALPPGGLVATDYVFTGAAPGGAAPVKLSDLFAAEVDTLAIYNMMFPRDPVDQRLGATEGTTASLPLHEGPCPSCVALLDQLDGAIEHVSPRLRLIIVAKAPLERVLAFASERGWRRLRLLSSAGNTYNRDYHGETHEGTQRPMLNVFSREEGGVRHFWGSEMLYAAVDPGQDPRHVGTLEPMWNLFDFTREGRGEDFEEQLRYPATGACGHC